MNLNGSWCRPEKVIWSKHSKFISMHDRLSKLVIFNEIPYYKVI
jgi:hypothetical protein